MSFTASNLQILVSVFLCDPPYNFQRDRGRKNSPHGNASKQDTIYVSKRSREVMDPGDR